MPGKYRAWRFLQQTDLLIAMRRQIDPVSAAGARLPVVAGLFLLREQRLHDREHRSAVYDGEGAWLPAHYVHRFDWAMAIVLVLLLGINVIFMKIMVNIKV